MLHLPQIAARWIKAHLAALHTDPGDPATTAADPATPAAEHAHRAGNLLFFCWELASVF